MFPGIEEGVYEPIKIRKKEKSAPQSGPANGATTNGDANHEAAHKDDEWEEDYVSEEGAIWPIRGGKIVDWPCFYALMTHVYNTVNPPFHTPIILISEPVWTTKEHEMVTRFFFEKFKTPAFTMVDSALAASYAYGITTATVIDVGHGKADITCITDSTVHDIGRSIAISGCGGEAMTERLVELLNSRKGFTRDVCEQLKKSNICEILPPDVEIPTGEVAAPDGASNPAAAASTGIDGGSGQRKPSIAAELPRGPGPGTQVGEEKKLEDDEGVLDIASIVTGGNMNQYLEKKEREKQEKAAAKQQKKSDAQQAAAAKPARLPNNKRPRNTFWYEDYALHNAMKTAGMDNQSMADMQSAMDEGPNKRQRTPEPQSAVSEKPPDGGLEGSASSTTASAFRREIEVGPERFQAVSGGILENLADAIHRTVQSCSDAGRRSDLWDSLILVGNGAKVRGYKEALLEKLQKKYIISPSSATIFTSELPSNLSTPMATGANTPQPQLPGQPHHGQGVNPLLLAATTAQNPALHPSALALGQQSQSSSVHSSHAQTPTSIKFAKIPEYFPEWKEVGYDEATFLGAQVAARVLFIVDAGASKGYMSRTDYNEQGPAGIHEVYL
jgi:actin-related protein 9